MVLAVLVVVVSVEAEPVEVGSVYKFPGAKSDKRITVVFDTLFSVVFYTLVASGITTLPDLR